MFGTLRNSDTSTSLYIVVRVSFIGTEQNKLFAYPTCRISQAKLKSSMSLCIRQSAYRNRQNTKLCDQHGETASTRTKMISWFSAR